MAMQHEKLPRDQAPRKGERYTVCREGTALYEADIIKYGGGCWATVQVVSPVAGQYADMYRPGDTFDMRVAMYEFRHTDDKDASTTPTGDCG